jgi:hypothetical protein
MSRLTDVRRLLQEDVPAAKAELRRHVESIELIPEENEEGDKILVASGEWNLLGGYVPRYSDGAGGRNCTQRLASISSFPSGSLHESDRVLDVEQGRLWARRLKLDRCLLPPEVAEAFADTNTYHLHGMLVAVL